MIHVVQGHEKGIGLEVFLKSILLIPHAHCSQIKLYSFEKTLEENLKNLGLPFQIDNSFFLIAGKRVDLVKLTNKSVPQSTCSLVTALESIKEDEVLFTLPTSKDQLIHDSQMKAGYTEFFRTYFKNNHIAMLFKGPRDLSLLLTDHIPLKEVTNVLSKDYVKNKVTVVLNSLNKYWDYPTDVIFSGINPHAGEGGILGSEESAIYEASQDLAKAFKNVTFLGPLPGDTLHFEKTDPNKTLQVYSYHDQGLIRFKKDNGLFGINISLGLPFLRLSVDHGTAFSLYGKNKADPNGCLYAIKEALRVVGNDNK